MVFSGHKNWMTVILLGSLSMTNGKIQLHSIRTESWGNASSEELHNISVNSSPEIDLESDKVHKDAESEMEKPQLELPVDECSSKYAEQHAVVTRLSLYPPCEGEGLGEGRRCILKRDVDYYLNGTLIPNIFSKNMTLQINQVDPNFGFDTQLHPRKSLCGKYGVECPMEADIPIDFLFTGKFPPSFPPLKLIVRIIVYADDDAIITCKQLPLDIQ